MTAPVPTGGPVPLDRAYLARHPLPTPEEGSKEHRGRVLVLGGSREIVGAALLAGVAALRAGAGKLQIGAPRSVAGPLAIAVPEARVIGLPETEAGGIAAEAAREAAELVAKAAAFALGPGMVEDEETAALALALLSAPSDATAVVDAAAMMRLGDTPAAVAARGGRVILTPHAGEMAKMLGRGSDAVEADPHGTALEAAALFGAVVALKGARTVVATPDGRSFLFEGGCVGLATSGSGDALAGIVAGVAARGAEPLQAALWGVLLHGEAGTRLARRVGPVGFLAREIADEVPALLAELG